MARNKKQLLIFSITTMRLQALLLGNVQLDGMLLLWLVLWHVDKHSLEAYQSNWPYPVRSSLKSFINVASICVFRCRGAILSLIPTYGSISSSSEERRSGHQRHPERSEGSRAMGTEILRCAQDDNLLPILFVTLHHCAPTSLMGVEMPWLSCVISCF